MKKNYLIKKIFLLTMSALIMSTNLFAVGAITTNENSSGATNFYSSSTNYQSDAEVGSPAVGRSVSSNYIFDHGVISNQNPSTVSSTTNNNFSAGWQSSYSNLVTSLDNKNGSSSLPINSPKKELTGSTTNINCGFRIRCTSIAIIKEVQFITNKLKNTQQNSSPITHSVAINIIPRILIYLVIAILLIFIIIFSYIKLKRNKQSLNKFSDKEK